MKDPLFALPYHQPDRISNIIDEADGYLKGVNIQTRKFIGLVQASMAGKTRLLIEIGLKRPLILISFKGDNVAFSRLLQEIPLAYTKTYADTLDRAHRIFLLTRVFYLAYAHFFNIYFNGDYNHSSVEQRKIFLALLLNGGLKLVEKLFIFLLDYYDFKSLNLSDLEVIQLQFQNNSIRYMTH